MAPFSFAFTLDEEKVFGDLVQAAASLEGRSIVQPPALKGVEELPEAVDDMLALVLAPPPPLVASSAASSSKAKPKPNGEETSATPQGTWGNGSGILW
jgi:hypothetical protein